MQTKINKIFKKTKSLPLDLFLEKVLYDNDFGYYQKKNPFGKKGDFVTAPNISKIFCEMIVIWLVSFWESLNKPKKINIVELGPGNGDFSEILVKTLKNFPQILKSVNIYLYEKSEKLTKFQKKRISSSKVLWIENFNEIKKGPVIFFGNEFLDALPIKQFKKVNGKVFERHAINVKNKVSFVFKKALKNDIHKLKKYQLFKKKGLIEFPEYGFKELNNICSVIRKQNGGVLFIDYGYVSENRQNTLQSVYKHKFNDLGKNIEEASLWFAAISSLAASFSPAAVFVPLPSSRRRIASSKSLSHSLKRSYSNNLFRGKNRCSALALSERSLSKIFMRYASECHFIESRF